MVESKHAHATPNGYYISTIAIISSPNPVCYAI